MLSKLHIISMQADTAIVKFLTLIVAILLLSFLIDALLSRSFFGKSYRIFVAPGVIVHELSHALVCFLTGAKMTRISFFEKNGGSVQHHPSKLPLLGPILISTAPFLFGAAIIYFLSRKLGVAETNLVSIDLSSGGVISFFKSAVSNINFREIKTIIIIYIVLSISVTMTPSFQDLRNMFLSLLAIGLSSFIILKITSFNLAVISIPEQAFSLLSTVFLLLILAFIGSIIIFALSKIIKPT